MRKLHRCGEPLITDGLRACSIHSSLLVCCRPSEARCCHRSARGSTRDHLGDRPADCTTFETFECAIHSRFSSVDPRPGLHAPLRLLRPSPSGLGCSNQRSECAAASLRSWRCVVALWQTTAAGLLSHQAGREATAAPYCSNSCSCDGPSHFAARRPRHRGRPRAESGN